MHTHTSSKIAYSVSFHKLSVNSALPTRGMKKGSLKLREAAIVSTGSRQPNRAPNRMSLPMWGSTGRRARWKPNAVRFSLWSRAFWQNNVIISIRKGIQKHVHNNYPTILFFLTSLTSLAWKLIFIWVNTNISVCCCNTSYWICKGFLVSY